MNLEVFFRDESAAWADLLTRFSQLTEADWIAPGATGEWTPKEVLTHLASWHRYMAEKLSEYAGGFAKLAPLVEADIDRMNEEFRERYRAWAIHEVRTLSRDAHTRAIVSVRAASYRPFEEPWEGLVLGNTIAHYDEHRPLMDTFLKERH